MDKHMFKTGIEELELFFKSFSPSADQLRAWYERLKDYSDDEYRLGIFWLTEESKTPGYKQIKDSVRRAALTLSKQEKVRVTINGGKAPMSDELRAHSQHFMKGLREALVMEDSPERDAKLDELLRGWEADYPHLPGYKSERECREIVDRGDWVTAKRYGLIDKHPDELKQVFVPILQSEKTKAVAV